mgnify:CR=1 FL=1
MPGLANEMLMLAEVARTMAGTLALRGPMVPKHAVPPGAERLNIPHLRAHPHGFVDTRYACPQEGFSQRGEGIRGGD